MAGQNRRIGQVRAEQGKHAMAGQNRAGERGVGQGAMAGQNRAGQIEARQRAIAGLFEKVKTPHDYF